MSYFEEVYLKRINRDGETQQERVKTRKEKEFNRLFLKKTEYQANIYRINENKSNIICSLQPNKWNEDKLISNVLVPTSCESFQTGDILSIFQKIKEVEYDKLWLILYCEENITKGYLNYKAICLDNSINITNEYGDTIYKIPVKMINESATFVKDLFINSKANGAYREPERDIKFITKSFDFLKKGTYFEYKNKGFEISGIDDISIDGVAYVSIQEKLLSPPEPKSSGQIRVDKDTNFFLNNR